jgi:hypothetical protein
MPQGLDIRAEDAAASPKHRSLYTTLPFTGDTTSAPLSSGNNNTVCGGLTDCINGCHSHFYKVTGVTTRGEIGAGTCGSADFSLQLYVWKGSGSDCSTFTCTSKYASGLLRSCVGWFGLATCTST